MDTTSITSPLRSPRTCALALFVALTTVSKPSRGAPPTWDLQSKLRLSLCYDETAIPRTGRDRSPVDSACTTVEPGIALKRRSGPDLIDMRYRLRAKMYEELSSRDAQAHYATLAWRKRVLPQTTLSVNDRFAYSLDSGGEQDEAVTRPTTYTNNKLKLAMETRTGETWRWLVDVVHERRLYDDHYFDNWYTISPTVGVEWRSTQHCRLSLRQELKHLSIEDADPERTRRTLAGYACRLPWNLDFDIRAGVLTLDDGTNTEPAGYVRFSRRWKKGALSVKWDRSTSISSGNARVVRRDYLVVQPRYRLTAKTQASARVGLVVQDSVGDDYTDTTTGRSGVTVRRTLARGISADVGYTYVDQNVRGRSGTPLSGSIVSMGVTAAF